MIDFEKLVEAQKKGVHRFRARVPPLLLAVARTRDPTDVATLVARLATASMASTRQFEDRSALATPATQHPVAGQLQSLPVTQPHPPGLVVDIIASMLADRADAASILTAVALRISSPPSVGSPSQHEQPGVQPSSPQPPSVTVVKELSRHQRDAALLKDAVHLSSSSSAVSSEDAVSPVAHGVSPYSPPPTPPLLLTTSTIPPSLRSSPSLGAIKRVLEAPVDYTLKVWGSRSCYEASTVTEYSRWSNPASPPHRDAPDALAALSDFDELGVPHSLLSAHPDTAATAWHHYRGLLLNVLHRAFAAGVDWRRSLRSLSLLFSDPDSGHPRISSYVSRAMLDNQLVLLPPLHADVLIFQLDVSFSAGSRVHGLSSHATEWERTTARLAGDDVLTLALRVVDAYLLKLSSSSYDTVSVWQSVSFTEEINDRFAACLLNDQSLSERGRDSLTHFSEELELRRGRVARGELSRPALSCIRIAEEVLAPLEASRAHTNHYNLSGLADLDDDAASEASAASSTAARSRGRGHRARRAATRALTTRPPLPQ